MADQVTWTAADGTVVALTDDAAGYNVLGDGTRGLRSVGYAVASQSYAGVDGTTVQAIRADPATPTLGMLIQGDDEDAFRARADRLRRLMRPKAGIGTLTVSRPNGQARSLACYCTGGFEGDESPGVTGGRWWKLALKFYAPSPWWEGDERTASFRLSPGANFFPAPPFTLAPSVVQGLFTLDLSDCDAPVYPRWLIQGPGSSLVLQNQTTGRSIEFNAPLAAGESLIIDTRPGYQSVRRGDGTNALGSLGTDPALFPLIEDVNTISAALVSATSDSRIVVSYRPRYAGI